MSANRYPCTVNGAHYQSEYEAAKDLEIGVSSLRFRLRSPSYPEYNSGYHPKKNHKSRLFPCSVAGVEYRSIGLAARKLGISYTLLKERLASPDFPDYVCAAIPKKTPKYTVRGKPYRTMQEIADLEGVTAQRIGQKMNSPLYPDYISANIPKRPPPEYMVGGKLYKTIQEIADVEGATEDEIRRKMTSPFYVDYICADIPKKIPKYMVKGRPHRTMREIADLEGVTAQSIRQKMISPLHPDYVSFFISKRPPIRRTYEANGKFYGKIKEIAEAEGLSAIEISKRLNSPSHPEYKRLWKKR